MTPILRVRNKDGNVVDVPAIIGPRGPAGKDGESGVHIGDTAPDNENVNVWVRDTDSGNTLNFISPPSKAEVGQFLQVESVDKTGKPVTWRTGELPIATPDTLGGVKPTAKTDAMTNSVGVDAQGRLWSYGLSPRQAAILYELFDSTRYSEDMSDVLASFRDAFGLDPLPEEPKPVYSTLLVERSLSGSYVNHRVTNIRSYAFYNNKGLEKLDFLEVTKIDVKAFSACTKLNVVILRGSVVPTLSNADAFSGTPIATGSGYIYVPETLIEDYQAATNFATYAAQFRAIEDYPDICGGEEYV